MTIRGSKGGCFPGWALVETPEGQVQIKDIRVGQRIICFDEQGELHEGVVEKKIEHDSDVVYKLLYWNGEVALTSNHWVLNQFGTFAEAGTLTEADAVVDKNGHLRPVVGFEEIGEQKVYNLTVSPLHTFICGGIRVHNGGRGVGRFQEFIEGEKGGSKGGGGSSSVYTPKEAANTLSSKAVARVIDLISEGECVGLVDGAKSIYFDGVALQNSDDSYNFQGVVWHQRYGTPDQDPIPGFTDIEAEVTVGQEIKYTAPVLFTINNTDVDAIRLKVQVNSLFEQLTNGDLVGASVDFKIEVSQNGGPYSTISTPSIEGKTVSTYEEAHRFSLPAGGPPYTVRVSRLAAESESAAKQDRIFVSGYTEITEAKLIYPNSALMGYEVDAQLFGGNIPNRAVDWKGIILQVPSNYDPDTREYDGVWDGTFQLAWSDNPAWVLYDILTHDRYGLGEWIDPTQVDKWALYQIAQYCDELVPDGFGGTEPRFTFNGYLATRQEAFAVINTIVSSFRGMAYWSAGSVTSSQDRPTDISRLVTPADIIEGEFQYSGSAAKARHSVALVSWNDPDDDYKLAVEVVEDREQIQKRGWNPIDVAAAGCTSRGQAHRLGKWILDSEKNESETVNFTASWDFCDTKPGDVIAVADPARQGVRMGGRIISTSNQTFVLEDGVTPLETEDEADFFIPENPKNTLVLDAPYTVVEGDQILVVLADDTIATYNLVVGSTGTEVATVETVGDIVPGAMYIIQNTLRIVPELWRVLGIVESDKHLFEVTALKHDPDKYARVEYGIVLEPRPTSLLPTGALVAPTNLAVQESLYKVNNALKTRVTISWTPSTDPRVTLYRVEVKSPSSNSFSTIYVGNLTHTEMLDAEDGDWVFNVYSISSSNSAGNISSRLQYSKTILGKYAPPGDVTGLTATRSYSGVTLMWNRVADLDLTGYDIRSGVNWDTGEIIAENFIGTSIFIEAKSALPVRYMVRARDELDVLSTTIASVDTQITPLPDLADFHAYQVGSLINLVWSGINGLEKIKYEIREGATFDSGRQVAVTNTPNFSGPFSVSTQTDFTFHVKAFINFDDGSRSVSDSLSTTITKYPTLGNNIIFSQAEDPTWSGTLSSNLEVTVDDKLTLITGAIEGYYDFEIDLGAEYFGRTWYEMVTSFLDADPLEVDEATMEVNDATFFITPFSSLTPQVQLYLLDGSDNIVKPFAEADYKFTTQKFRVILRMDTGDSLKPAVDNLSTFFDLPDFML